MHTLSLLIPISHLEKVERNGILNESKFLRVFPWHRKMRMKLDETKVFVKWHSHKGRAAASLAIQHNENGAFTKGWVAASLTIQHNENRTFTKGQAAAGVTIQYNENWTFTKGQTAASITIQHNENGIFTKGWAAASLTIQHNENRTFTKGRVAASVTIQHNEKGTFTKGWAEASVRIQRGVKGQATARFQNALHVWPENRGDLSKKNMVSNRFRCIWQTSANTSVQTDDNDRLKPKQEGYPCTKTSKHSQGLLPAWLPESHTGNNNLQVRTGNQQVRTGNQHV